MHSFTRVNPHEHFSLLQLPVGCMASDCVPEVPHMSCCSMESLYLLMGRDLEELQQVPAGNVLGRSPLLLSALQWLFLVSPNVSPMEAHASNPNLLFCVCGNEIIETYISAVKILRNWLHFTTFYRYLIVYQFHLLLTPHIGRTCIGSRLTFCIIIFWVSLAFGLLVVCTKHLKFQP